MLSPISRLLSSWQWPQMTNLWFISAHHTILSFGFLLSTNFERLETGQDPVSQHQCAFDESLYKANNTLVQGL